MPLPPFTQAASLNRPVYKHADICVGAGCLLPVEITFVVPEVQPDTPSFDASEPGPVTHG